MFYIDEINPQCKGDSSCGKPSSYTIFIRRVQSYSCEWLKHTSENGGTPPTVALVKNKDKIKQKWNKQNEGEIEETTQPERRAKARKRNIVWR